VCGPPNLLALPSEAVTTDVQAAVELKPLTGEGRPISEWTTNFHLAIVVLDPYTNESSWILKTALRVLRNYSEADVRIALLVTASEAEAKVGTPPNGPLWQQTCLLAWIGPFRRFQKMAIHHHSQERPSAPKPGPRSASEPHLRQRHRCVVLPQSPSARTA